MQLEVVQLLRPDGRERKIVLDDVPDSYAPIVDRVRKCGCRLTAEVLTTDQVSFAIEHGEGDVDVEICPNALGTRDAMFRLLDRFDTAWPEFLKHLMAIGFPEDTEL